MDRKAKAAAAEEKRKKNLHEELKRKDATELKLYAQQHSFDLSGAETVADMRAKIELLAEEVAKKAATEEEIKHLEDEEMRKIAREGGDRDQVNKDLRALNALFCSAVPQAARDGSFEPEKGDPVFGGEYEIPNGKYRVVGSEWVFEIRKGKLAGVVRAAPQNGYGGKDVIAVA